MADLPWSHGSKVGGWHLVRLARVAALFPVAGKALMPAGHDTSSCCGRRHHSSTATRPHMLGGGRGLAWAEAGHR